MRGFGIGSAANSPYLRLNERIKELLEDKNRLKIDVRIVYGKTDLRPDEADCVKGGEACLRQKKNSMRGAVSF